MIKFNLLHVALWVFSFLVIGLGLTYWEFHQQMKELRKKRKKRKAEEKNRNPLGN